ncbi:MAG: hypothetical protein WCT04_22115 [Planctomycetota bacterium]
MGVSLTVYTTDFKRFLALFGCQDFEVLKQIVLANEELLDEEELPMNAREKDEGEPFIRELLAEFVVNDIENINFHGPCANAISMMINFCSNSLESQERADIGEYKKLDPLLIKHGFPKSFSSSTALNGGLPAPFPKFEFETFGHVPPEEIQRIASNLKPIDVLGVAPDLARRVIKFIAWVKAAAAENTGLIFVWS